MTQHPHAAKSLSAETLERLQRRDTVEAEGQHNGLDYKVQGAFNPDAPRWPNVESHLWGAFPFLAIELDGYNDFSIQDPATGRRLWTRYPKYAKGTPDEVSWYDRLRHLVDVMEATGFLTEPDGTKS